MRVCYFGTYRHNYARNQIMIAGLRKAGVDVIECHETLWHGTEDRIRAVEGGWTNPRFWGRVCLAYLRLIKKYVTLRSDFDVMVVCYPGQFDVFLARFLSRLRGKPLVWDVLLSIYLVSLERKLDRSHRFTVELLRRVERLALHQADRLILETSFYADYLAATHNISAERFRVVPIGADERIFFPRDVPHAQDDVFRVMYYGSFIPLHGVDVMLEAAEMLQNDPTIQFEFIGKGPEQPAAVLRAHELKLQNVTFIEWLDQKELSNRIASADLCLGVFGSTSQSLMTLQNKIFEGLAMRKTVLSGKSPAVEAFFKDGEHLVLCERTPQALASAIHDLRADPANRQRIADSGYRRFCERFDLLHTGQTFASILEEVV